MSYAKVVWSLFIVIAMFSNCHDIQADNSAIPLEQKVSADDLGRWENVVGLRKGKRIEITSRDGRMIRGKLLESNPESVTIRNEITGQNVSWQKREVQQIKEPRMETPKPLSVGLAIGAALGAGIGAGLAGGSNTSKAAIPIGAGMGAVGGALLGDAYSKHHKGKVIYLSGP